MTNCINVLAGQEFFLLTLYDDLGRPLAHVEFPYYAIGAVTRALKQLPTTDAYKDWLGRQPAHIARMAKRSVSE